MVDMFAGKSRGLRAELLSDPQAFHGHPGGPDAVQEDGPVLLPRPGDQGDVLEAGGAS